MPIVLPANHAVCHTPAFLSLPRSISRSTASPPQFCSSPNIGRYYSIHLLGFRLISASYGVIFPCAQNRASLTSGRHTHLRPDSEAETPHSSRSIPDQDALTKKERHLSIILGGSVADIFKLRAERGGPLAAYTFSIRLLVGSRRVVTSSNVNAWRSSNLMAHSPQRQWTLTRRFRSICPYKRTLPPKISHVFPSTAMEGLSKGPNGGPSARR